MKMNFKYCLLVSALFVSACDYPAPEYPNLTPESHLDVSTETATVSIGTKKSLTKLRQMIAEDRPSGAELGCSIKNTRCAQAKEILESNSVPVRLSDEASNNVILVYERVIARDCSPRYVDNMSGSRSYNHPAFSCAVNSNIIQMVSDKHQFTNPALTDLPDAEKANQSYSGYLMSPGKRPVSEAKWSTSGGGGSQ